MASPSSARILSIGELSKLADVKIPTIRFYEQIGLLPVPQRTQSKRRVYGDAAVRRLSFIHSARQLGFSMEAIRALLDLADGAVETPEEAARMAAEQLAHVEIKIAQLESLRLEIAQLRRSR